MQRLFDMSAHITAYRFDTKFGSRPSRIDLDGQSYRLTDAGITIRIGRGTQNHHVLSVSFGQFHADLHYDSRGWSVARVY